MRLTKQIKDDFGTLKHFCKVTGINVGSLSVIMTGSGKSQPCVDALIAHGYIKKASDLPQYQGEARKG